MDWSSIFCIPVPETSHKPPCAIFHKPSLALFRYPYVKNTGKANADILVIELTCVATRAAYSKVVNAKPTYPAFRRRSLSSVPMLVRSFVLCSIKRCCSSSVGISLGTRSCCNTPHAMDLPVGIKLSITNFIGNIAPSSSDEDEDEEEDEEEEPSFITNDRCPMYRREPITDIFCREKHDAV